MIHATADVQTKNIGKETQVWQYSVILKGAKIGSNCNINCHVFIENNVIIGDCVTIKSGVQLWDGLRIKNNVFVGPNVTFTNDKHPRSKQYPREFQKTVIQEKASLGGGCIILGGREIGKYAMIGAGAVVTKDVPERALVIGNPGRIVGWLNEDGTQMKMVSDSLYVDKNGMNWKVTGRGLVRL